MIPQTEARDIAAVFTERQETLCQMRQQRWRHDVWQWDIGRDDGRCKSDPSSHPVTRYMDGLQLALQRWFDGIRVHRSIKIAITRGKEKMGKEILSVLQF